MRIRSVLAAGALLLASSPALAQPLFSDPFANAATYRAERGDLADATYRVRYEATVSDFGGEPVTTEIAIDVAPDWSLVRDGERAWLRDFRLNRSFVLEAEAFSTMNGLADVTFRVMERQNRVYLQGIFQQLQLADDNPGMVYPDACDVDSELGLALPGMEGGATALDEQGWAVTLTCAEREIASYERGDGAPAPPAFWPTLFGEMPTHPVLFQSMKESGLAPALIRTSFRVSPDAVTERTWRLIAVENIATPYPLTEDLRNVTAEQLEETVAPGAAQLAVDAVAGRAQGGAPTLESWGEHLEAVSEDEGPSAAMMLLMPTLNMFPELVGTCDAGDSHPYCTLADEFRQQLESGAPDDPAPIALLQVGMAEQARNPAGVIEAMQQAQSSPLKDHPALGGAFALALMRFDQQLLDQATAAGLPTDVAALQAAAVSAFPYNPAYWTDIGDRYAGGYKVDAAFLLYDVAFSLPTTNAEENGVLVSHRDGMERLRNDFPDAFLSR